MGFYAPAQLVRDAKAHGVKVLPVDVNASHWHATLETGSGGKRPAARATGDADPQSGQPAIRLGLEQVYGLGEAAGRRIEAARREGPFQLPRELARRAALDREALLHLARAGAFGSLGLDRRRAVWEAMRCLERPAARPLLEDLDDEEDDGDLLPALTPQEEVIADYRTAGLSLEAHPLQFEREWLAAHGVATVAEAVGLPEGRRVLVAGIVLTRQRPATAKGMIFLTIEDETGAANIVVHPHVWEGADLSARRAAVLVVHGRIQRRGVVVHVVSTRLESAAALRPEETTVASLPRMSRDFC
jgi:error-prone DNA polymerase